MTAKVTAYNGFNWNTGKGRLVIAYTLEAATQNQASHIALAQAYEWNRDAKDDMKVTDLFVNGGYSKIS